MQVYTSDEPSPGPKSRFLQNSKGNQNYRNSGLEGNLASEENQIQRQHAIYMCSSPKISCREVVPGLLCSSAPGDFLSSYRQQMARSTNPPERMCGGKRSTPLREGHVTPYLTVPRANFHNY